MKRTTAFLLIWLAALLCHAAFAAETLLVNGDFEMGGKGWNLPANAQIESFSGYDGTAALRLRRQTADADADAVEQELRLPPDGIYTLEAWMKSIDLRGAVQICIRFFDRKNSPIDRFEKVLEGPDGTTEWTARTLDFLVPHDAATCRLAILLPPQATGTAYVDKLSIRPTDRPFALALVHPVQGALDADQPMLRIAIAKPGAANLPETLIRKTLRITWNGHQALRAAQPLVEIQLERTSLSSQLNLLVELIDHDTQKVDTTLQTTLHLRTDHDDSACRIDARQRAVTGGRPMLPVGLVLGQATPSSFPHFQETTPFVCVALTPQAVAGISSPEELRAVMDAWKQLEMRVVFPLADDVDKNVSRWPWYIALAPTEDLRRERLVSELADHPALLAWQLPAANQPDEDAHRQITRLDFAHPVWRLLDGARDMTEFRRDGDLLGVSVTLPHNQEDSCTLARVFQALENLKQTHLGIWVTVRMPSDGLAKPEILRALTLLLALQGVHGVFFDTTSENRDDAVPSGEFPWKLLDEQAALLHELAPYLLSNIPSREVPLQLKKGEAIAREFTDHQGNRVVLLVGGLQPGKTEALFALPGNVSPVSRYGATRRFRNGNWSFTGRGVCCDLVEIPAAGNTQQ